MSDIGDEDMAAPVLHSVRLTRAEARPLFERVLRNIEIMLANQRVHGDLSAYNILYWDGDICLIDFPQVIDPEGNRNAFHIFERDVTRICEYFARQGVASSPHRLAADLWTAHRYRLSPEIHPALLDEQDERDIAYWKSQRGG
jgi:RIO kinase 1